MTGLRRDTMRGSGALRGGGTGVTTGVGVAGVTAATRGGGADRGTVAGGAGAAGFDGVATAAGVAVAWPPPVAATRMITTTATTAPAIATVRRDRGVGNTVARIDRGRMRRSVSTCATTCATDASSASGLG